MGARTKLNQANILGALAVAGIIGGVSGSWTAFMVAAVALIGAAVYAGDIRSQPHRRKPGR